MNKPITREIRLKARRLKSSLKAKPSVFLTTIKFFQGKKRVFNKVETEKKYGKKMKRLTTTSRKFFRESLKY